MPKLIEKRLPLTEVSKESAREKSIRHGHISTLHIWWARRPLAASRAAVFGTLVEDSDEAYELVKDIVPWEAVKDGNSPAILKAREAVLNANGGKPPKVLDPFGGGGAIPLEALRLGCETYSLDLNPVAHLIQRATLEYPQKYGQPTANPAPAYLQEKDAEASHTTKQGNMYQQDGAWASAYKENPLATNVRYWGEWVLERARAELADFYPPDEDGKTPVAYLWARTVTCTNPACRAEVPMVRSWWLAKKSNKRLASKPIVDTEAKTVRFEVQEVGSADKWMDNGTMTRDNTTCLICGTVMDGKHLRATGRAGKLGERMMTVVLTTPGEQGKSYRPATDADKATFEAARQQLDKIKDDPIFPGLPTIPDDPILEYSGVFNAPLYGLDQWGKLFNPRQALALVTFAKWVREAHTQMVQAGMEEDEARATTTYLGIAVDRLTDKVSTLVTYESDREKVSHTFVRQALPMVWDYCEASVLASIGWEGAIGWIDRIIGHCSKTSIAQTHVLRGSAIRVPLDDNYLDAIITDPPYYDAVPYADLSDFFYVWLKRTIGHLYPSEFRVPTTPKAQEIVQNPIRHGGDNAKAKAFYEEMMTKAFQEMHRVLKPAGEATIVFAHKSTDAWETLIGALINAGFKVEASWPLNTEMATRLRARAALASSTFLNCTKRTGESVGYFNDVRREMQESILPQLESFWQAGIRGADFFMSAIGPGLESYSKHSEVRRASGESVGVGEFLDEVRAIVLQFALSHVMKTSGAQQLIDEPTEFAMLALWAYGFELPSDEARKLAQSMSVELSALADARVVEVKGEKARVLHAAERLKKDDKLGLPKEDGVGAAVLLVDAMHRTVMLLKKGRQEIADYLGAVGYLDSEAFWRTTQAFAEILDGDDEGRALDELLTLRDNLPKPREDAQTGLFG